MNKFDFDEIVAKIPQAYQWKKDNYYTNYYGHVLNEYDFKKELIWVEDYSERSGWMTLTDFSRYIGTPAATVKRYFEEFLQNDNMINPRFFEVLKHYFKDIKIANVREIL